MTETMTIQELADKLYNQLEVKERNGKQIVVSKNVADKQVTDLTFYVNQNTSLSMDSVYSFTWDALGIIADASESFCQIDYLRELGAEIEADVYTSDLTEWLAESINHVDYLTQALQEYGDTDGPTALAAAQALAKQEVFNAVLDYLAEKTGNE